MNRILPGRREIRLSDTEFQRIRKFVHESFGLNLGESKKSMVEGRLLKRLRQMELDSFGEYFQFVHTPEGRTEREVMIDLLTTHETYFFREQQHYRFLAEAFRNHYRTREVRIWCGGVSSGEEAYSVGMICQEDLGNGQWSILGTDISRGSVEAAKSAIYPIEAAEKIPAYYLKKYCLKGVREKAGTLLIDEPVRKHVRFEQGNLLDEKKPEGFFDIIFLRNVMIYFDAPTKQACVKNVTRHLKKDGLLFIGHSESIAGMTSGFELVQQSVYRKNE